MIVFDEYPPYSVRISEILEINVNENIQCFHGYPYSSGKQKTCTWVNEESWGMMKTYFPDAKQIKKCPKTVLCKECTYVQKYMGISSLELNPNTLLDYQFFINVFFVEFYTLPGIY